MKRNRVFPFDEEDGSGAWSELAARHPDIAARLRQRPAAWARKRRPSSQDHTDDFGDEFGGFDRFPFDDIPPEFREHFPSRWNRRFAPRDEPDAQTHPQQPQQQQPPPQQQQPSTQQQTTSTQTEQNAGPAHDHTYLPQYGLRNTVDLGQKSPADPSLVDAEERSQRSMSAPPDHRANQTPSKMSDQNHHEQPHTESSNVRHIPIFVEGRDEPVINKNVDHGEPKQAYAPPPQPHVDREQYFADDGAAGFHAPTNFSRAFGTPFNTFRQGPPQPYAQQKVYPQTAYSNTSPRRSQSPKPHFPEKKFGNVPPMHHEFFKPAQKSQPPPQQRAPQQQPPPQPEPPQQHKQPTPPRQEPQPQQEQAPPQPKPQPANDPICQILSIQTDVLNLMTEVENFTGTKKDKKYIFLDEMLTRNLIKLDNIETDGKENIRQARKEAIRCIQKCIAVLEAKADNKNLSTPQPQEQPQEAPLDVEMKENSEAPKENAVAVTENGEVEMKEATKEEEKSEQQPEQQNGQPKAEEQSEPAPDNKENEQTQTVDTRPEENQAPEEPKAEKKKDDPKKPKAKNAKKRDKSKDNKPEVNNKQAEVMQVDDKGDKSESQTMEVDSAASQ
ncbi:BAG domain-containing protein Samui isoform X2 [Amyelois transitella]|uniref:BAG domain-containing protein Samui isoform X2 n=1 Tax=Amyelois transitella TaxID=680683 RepID=UPI0029908196|nr:BAG domain-containing protein Samui isoform X2 [Amyelois transitella]